MNLVYADEQGNVFDHPDCIGLRSQRRYDRRADGG